MIAALLVAAASTGSIPHARALRISDPPRIDGKLDDTAWQSAAVLDGFVQRMPDEGKPASERTEVRIVYDESAIYVSFRCWDSQASEIHPRLARRDNLPNSDWVAFAVDPAHDRRSAYLFIVNSAGVLQDGINTEGQGDNYDWDGVWDAQTSIDADGWSAEMRIPLSTLRFPAGGAQTWGFHVRRRVARLDEQDDWNLIGRNDASFVGRFADLDGVEGVRPGLSLRVAPYVSATIQPTFAATNLAPRDQAFASAGVDLKYALSGTLTLDTTINPDFGQVEVDPEVVNLSAYEVWFPEKRQFFLEGLDIFQGVGSIVYTRRIGAPPSAPDPEHGGDIVSVDRTARILGAAKVTGNLRPGTAIGQLLAYVDETNAVEKAGADAWVLRATAPTLFSASRVRQLVGGQSTVGLTETSVIRGSGGDAHVVAADADVRGRSNWTAAGGAGWSVTDVCTHDCNAGVGSWNVGKTGGEWKLYDNGNYLGPDAQLNDLGFVPHLIGNEQISQSVHAGYVSARPWRFARSIWSDVSYQTSWDPAVASSELVDHGVALDASIRFRSQWELGTFVRRAFERFDDAETRLNSRVRLWHRDAMQTQVVRVRSDDTRAFFAQWLAGGDVESGTWTWFTSLEGNLLAGGRVQLGARAGWTQWLGRPRWVTTADDGLPLFGDLEMGQLELTLRAQAAFTRTMTLQLFTQVLQSDQHYPRLRELIDARTFAPPMTTANYDQNLTSLITNAVLRWEYQPGSTLFVAYTHNHQAPTLAALGTGSADNVLALKLSYLWSM